MSGALRVLHLADTHIGAELPARPRANRPRRGDDFVRSFRRALGHAISCDGTDLVIHAGDLFDMPNPSAAAVTAAGMALLEVASAGVPIVIVPGNHERCAIPASILLAHPNIHIVREPTTLLFRLRGVEVAVSALPCIRRGSATAFAGQLAATGWERASADIRLLALHQTIESAKCGPDSFRFRSGDDVIDRDTIPVEFDYVALGHVHRPQTLRRPAGDGPPIVYCGSTDRISFAEIDEPKGAVLIEEAGGRLCHRYVEHAVRPMAILPLDVSERSLERVVDDAMGWIRSLPTDAMAQVRLSGQTTARAIRGLSLAARAERDRPDVLLQVASQGVLFVTERAAGAVSQRLATAFSQVAGGSGGPSVVRQIDQVGELPRGCGTYAFFDAEDRLLYVGKAVDVRTRVRSHLADKGSGFHAAWARQIALVAVWPAGCEAEALLREADLIRRLRPPFNSQMRSWERYRYIERHAGEWRVLRQASGAAGAFGPVRSRHSAERIVEALTALPECGSVLGLAADAAIERLSGVAARLGAQTPLEELSRDAIGDSLTLRYVATLHQAVVTGALLGDAERMTGGLLLLPGQGGSHSQVAVVLGRSQCRWYRLSEAADCGELLRLWRTEARIAQRSKHARLEKSLADAYCLLARLRRRGAIGGRFLSWECAERADARMILQPAHGAAVRTCVPRGPSVGDLADAAAL